MNVLWPDWNVKGKLGPLVQPLSTVATVTTVVSPQWRSVREQPVPFEVQVWLFWSTPEDTAVATYWSACPAALQVTWPTLPAHCRDTCTLVGGQGPGGQRKGKTALLKKYSQNIPTKILIIQTLHYPHCTKVGSCQSPCSHQRRGWRWWCTTARNACWVDDSLCHLWCTALHHHCCYLPSLCRKWHQNCSASSVLQCFCHTPGRHWHWQEHRGLMGKKN